ncbi:thioredoxin domain-containing protein 6-like isoform X3 [Symsagittifera roscoffensis]|uniref:thioredoxin domain-containing protein 6-like isoform X3 n=1 Tax=Symsagittifera roscoffensis TaxID=84072 RepID=UPI00307C1468
MNHRRGQFYGKQILNDEQWEKELEHNGILVIDAYQKWAGPCKATVALFRRVKNELGDDLLGFAVAETDNISALSFYRGKCKPTFLFYAGGKLQSVVRSCNAPALERTIQEQLTKEHKVQSGDAERAEYVDPQLEAQRQAEEDARLEALKPKPVPKTCSVFVIKPDAVEAGHVEEILEKLRENGMEIVKSEEKQLTEEETREMYKVHEEEPWFEELIELMTGGPCHIAIVTKGATGEEVIPELRKLVGPTDAEKAKEEDPESLRALYGTSKLVNGVHAADSKEQAANELAFFFPNADLPMQEQKEPGKLQRTLAIIRPDAYRERGEEILSQIKASGFDVALQKELHLTREQAEGFYAEHKDEPFFQMLVDNMTSGPVLALGLAREDAIDRWRGMLGPKEKEAAQENPSCLRAQFDVEAAQVNQLHGSDSPEAAEKEIEFFFPKEKTLAVIKPNAMNKKEEIMARIREAGFEVSSQKESHLTKEMAESFYGEHADKEFFDQLVEFMSSGDTLFMVLTREDAVNEFRRLAGNKDPEAAKNEAPDSIRAMFGDDILRNAVHGSSTVEQAFEKISKVFDDEQKRRDSTTASLHEASAEGDEEKTEDAAPAEEAATAEPSAQQQEDKKEEGETTEEATTEDKPEDATEDAEQKTAADETSPAEEQKPDEAKAEEQTSEENKTDEPTTEEPKDNEEGEQKPEEPVSPEADATKPADEGETKAEETGGDETKTEDEKTAEDKPATEGTEGEKPPEGETKPEDKKDEAPAS